MPADIRVDAICLGNWRMMNRKGPGMPDDIPPHCSHMGKTSAPPRTRRRVPKARNSSLSSLSATAVFWGSTAVRSSLPTKRSASSSSSKTRPRQTGCGAPSLATAARKACAFGARTAGAFHGRSPRVLLAAAQDPDRAAAKRAMNAMMAMRKIDIAAIEAARAGEPG